MARTLADTEYAAMMNAHEQLRLEQESKEDDCNQTKNITSIKLLRPRWKPISRISLIQQCNLQKTLVNIKLPSFIFIGKSVSTNAKLVGSKLTHFFQNTPLLNTKRNSLEVNTDKLEEKRDEEGFYDFESKTPTTPSVDNVKQKATISIGKSKIYDLFSIWLI